MSYRFDETDSVLVCDRVKIPWERVFLHNDAAMSRRIYIETPANCYQNHQSNIRFWSKMGLIVGVASRICQANGTDKIPAVRETLGRLASLEALIGGLVHGPDRGLGGMARGLRHAEPPHHVCGAELVPGASHRDHRHAAHAARRLPDGDAGVDRRDDRRYAARHASSAGGRRRRSRRSSGTSSTSSPGTSSAPSSPAATCCTRNSTPAARSWCATRATARRRGRASTTPWTGCWPGIEVPGRGAGKSRYAHSCLACCGQWRDVAAAGRVGIVVTRRPTCTPSSDTVRHLPLVRTIGTAH